MIDLYTDIVPKKLGASKAFQEAALLLTENGIHTIIANEQGLEPGYLDDINHMLESRVVPLRVMPGGRVPISERFIQESRGNFQTINDNNKYMLLHISHQEKPVYMESLIYELQLDQLVPIISEPERHPYFLEHKEELYKLVKQGALVQISSDSIIGIHGKKVKQAAFEFLEHNLAHVVASGVTLTNYKKYSLPKAYKQIEKAYGASKVDMLMENAVAIVDGKGVQTLPPERVKKAKFLGLF